MVERVPGRVHGDEDDLGRLGVRIGAGHECQRVLQHGEGHGANVRAVGIAEEKQRPSSPQALQREGTMVMIFEREGRERLRPGPQEAVDLRGHGSRRHPGGDATRKQCPDGHEDDESLVSGEAASFAQSSSAAGLNSAASCF